MLLNGNPIAQTFTIEGTSSVALPGIFLTQIGVFFKSKSATAGISCVVCQTTNGIPNTSKVMGSVYKSASSVTVSEDSSSETIFTFSTPIMAASGQTYAFYVYPESNSPDYNMWVSEIGGVDKITGRAITQQPYPGVMFISSNGNTWTPVQTQDIKFNLYRANFAHTTGTAVFRNAKEEYLSLNLTAGIIKKATGGQIQTGDVVYAANATSLSSILTSNNTLYPKATVKSVDEIRGILFLENTNGLFSITTPNYSNIRIYRTPDPANTSYITETYRVANATISTIDDLIYHGLIPKFTMSEPTGTYISSGYYGTSNSTLSNAKDTTKVAPKNESLYEFRDFERVVRSYSNEVKNGTYGTKGTATFELELNSYTSYLSPVVDLQTKNINYTQNIINNDETNEWTRYGNGRSKYISKTVLLDDISEDLLVYVTGYRPVGTNIKVYGKFLNSVADPGSFDTKVWTELSPMNDTGLLFGSPKNLEDYKEYVYGVPVSASQPSGNTTLSAYADSVGNIALDVPPGTLTYYDEVGTIIRGFDTFSIKILLLSDDMVKYPTMKDVRAIALQI